MPRAVVALVAPLVVATPAGAQLLRPSLSMGTGIANIAPATTDGALLIAPGLGYANGGFTAVVDSRLAWTGGEHRASEISGAARFTTVTRAPLVLDVALRLRGMHFDALDVHGEALASAQGEFRTGTTGFFLQGEAGRAGREGDAGSLLRVRAGVRSETGPRRIELNLSTTRFVARVAPAGAASPPDTAFIPPSQSGPRRAMMYTQTELRMDWRGASWLAGLEAGARVRSDNGSREAWGQVHAQKRVTDGLDITAAAGWAAASPELRLSARPVANLALRFAPPTLFRSDAVPRGASRRGAVTNIVDLGNGYHLLRIPARDAERVEIIADFTDWRVQPLRPTRDGFWVIELHLPPGHYRINVRYDSGPWSVPPGLATTRDEFDGLTGVLLIE